MKKLLLLTLLFSSFMIYAQEKSKHIQENEEISEQVPASLFPQVKEIDSLKEKTVLEKKETSFSKAAEKVKEEKEYILKPSNCKASPLPTIVAQPNGTFITIFGKGNFNNSWTETSDGYTIALNTNGNYEYVNKVNGALVPDGVLAHDPGARTIVETSHLQTKPKALTPNLNPLKSSILNQVRTRIQSKVFPSSGNIRVLALLIDYPNLTSTYTRTDFDSLMNGLNYRNGDGSFKVFFETASHGLLTVDVDVYGWYRAANNYAYYGNNMGSGRAANLVREAVDAAELAGVNFALYDNNSDLAVDGILAVHAGPGAEQGSQLQYIWSHRWVLNGGSSGAVTYDGVYINDYMINPETRTSGSSQNIVGIGVVCHEFGHNLGLPDLYDTDNTNGGSEGIGEWGLMGGAGYLGGEHRPGNFCAWSKIENGWDTPINLTIGTSGSYTLNPASTTRHAIYRVNTNRSNEYFLLENRQKTGLDSDLNGEGLAVWHINTTKTNSVGNGVNADENLKGVDLEEADGLNDLDNEVDRGDNGDLFPGSTTNRTFDDSSNPDAKNYLNATTGLQLRNITETGTSVSFDFGPTIVGLSPGDTVHTQTFPSSLPSGWTSTSAGNPSFIWVWSNSAPGGQFSTGATAMNSTSSSNGFLSMRADFYNTPIPPTGSVAMDATVQSNAITIPSMPSVLIRMQQYVGYCCNANNELVLEVSNNGVTWTSFDAVSDLPVNSISANVDTIEFNVSSVLANQTTAYYRFRMTGASHYFWMVDDVAIVRGFDNAMELEEYDVNFSTAFTYNPKFTIVPKAVADPITFSGDIINSGSITETGVRLRAEVFNNITPTPVYSVTRNLVGNSAPLQQDNLSISSPAFTANYTANFSAEISVESNSVNQRPSRAKATYAFEFSDSVFAKDRGVFNGNVGPRRYQNGGNNGDRWCSLYSMGQTGGVATSVSFYVDSSANNVGAGIRPQIWYWNDSLAALPTATIANSISLVSSTLEPTYIVTAADLGTWIHLHLINPVILNPAEQYAVGWQQISRVSSTGNFVVGRDFTVEGSIEPVTNFLYLSATSSWGWVSAVGGVRLNFGNIPSPVDNASIMSVKGISEEYTNVPHKHFDIPNQGGWIRNNGSSNLSNVKLKYQIFKDGVVFRSDSTPAFPTLVVGDSVQLISTSTPRTFPVGEYYIRYEIGLSGSDIDLTDNVFVSDTVSITDSVYARDNDIATGALGIGPGTHGELGSIFKTKVTDTLTSVTVYISNLNGSMTGQPLSLNLRDFSGAPNSIIASSDTITYTAAAGSYVDLTFNNAGGYIILPADTFFVGVVERDSNVSIGTSPIIATPGTGWVDFTTNPFGRWANNEEFNFIRTYLIRPNFGLTTCIPPIADFSLSSDTICLSDTLNLLNTSTSINSGTSYSWDVGNDGSFEYSFENTSHVFSATGNSLIKLIVQQGSCVDSAIKSVHIKTESNASNMDTICVGDSYTFLDGTTISNITSQLVYTNVFQGANSCDSNIVTTLFVNPTYSILETVSVCPGGSYTFPDGSMQTNITSQVVYTSMFQSASMCDSNIVTTVNINPIYSMTEVDSVCSGASYTFPDGSMQSNVVSQIIHTSMLLSANMCDSSITTTVNVKQSAIADAGPDHSVCISRSVIIGSNFVSGSTYSWNNGSSLSSSTVHRPLATPTITTIYVLSVTNTSGCTSIDSVTVTVNPLPTVDAGADQFVCSGDSVQIGGTPTGPAGSTYIWNNGSSLNSATSANPLAFPTINRTYTVRVTDLNACSAIDQVLVSVLPSYSNTTSATICSGDSYTFPDGTTQSNITAQTVYTSNLLTADLCDSVITTTINIDTVNTTVLQNGVVLTSQQFAGQYQWLDCNNGNSAIAGATNQSFTATMNGNYAVELSNLSCTDTSTCLLVSTVGLLDNFNSGGFKVFPNPTNGIVNLEFGDDSFNGQLVVRDILGKKVSEYSIFKSKKFNFEMNGARGIYFVELISESTKETFKLIVR